MATPESGAIAVLAEKPSVARDIARVLGAGQRGEGFLHGNGYVVVWAVGHLAALAQPHEIRPEWRRWSRDLLPMLPREWPLVVYPGTQDQFEAVKKVINSSRVASVVCATDAGREGELIFRYIYEAAGCSKPFQRLWISSLTPEAIRKGFDRLRPGSDYDPLADAARGRSRADWLVGMNLSRAYTLACGEDLSVGRVQTPTLAMLVERELAIRDFVPEDYMEVVATFHPKGAPAATRYKGTWFRPAGKGQADKESLQQSMRLPPDGEEAGRIVERAQSGEAAIESVRAEQQRMPPPPLYDLTELQRHANRLYGFSAQKTLDLAQALYERHKLISYPRTDSRHLSRDVAETLPRIVRAIEGPYRELLAEGTGERPLGRRFVDDAKVSDHHAIIPTATSPAHTDLPADERRIYDLICRRLLSAWHGDHVWSVTTVVTAIVNPGVTDRYHTSGSAVDEQGWKVLDIAAERRGRRGEGEEEQPLPAGLAAGQPQDVVNAEAQRKRTRPPKRFTEGALLTAMETAGKLLDDKELSDAMKENGLGTPATRASIIEVLLKRGYIVRAGKSLEATEKGVRLIGVVHPEVKSPAMTGQWEAYLKRIERGGAQLEPFLRGIEDYVREVVGKVSAGGSAQRVTPGSGGFQGARPRPPGGAGADTALSGRGSLTGGGGATDRGGVTGHGGATDRGSVTDHGGVTGRPVSDPGGITGRGGVTGRSSATDHGGVSVPGRVGRGPATDRGAVRPPRPATGGLPPAALRGARVEGVRSGTGQQASLFGAPRSAAKPREGVGQPGSLFEDRGRASSPRTREKGPLGPPVQSGSLFDAPGDLPEPPWAGEEEPPPPWMTEGSAPPAYQDQPAAPARETPPPPPVREDRPPAAPPQPPVEPRPTVPAGEVAATASRLLREVFGFSQFRPNQEAVCHSAIAGHDVLLVMPTGSGKSLCYQLPGLAREGTTLVVSPLIALMEDQVAHLKSLGLAVERVHSGRERSASRQACIDYLNGRLQFLFIAPERLRVAGFPEMLAKRRPSLVAIDEAHCISQWGHDFRPDYRKIGEYLPQLRPCSVMALTATATPIVQDDICVQLGLESPVRFIHGFRRENIAIELVEAAPSARTAMVHELLRDPHRRPAIVYAPTRKQTEAVAAEIRSSFAAEAYHAGLDSEHRKRVQEAFQAGRIEVMAATIAFGMGIDKPDVRTVIHTALPGSLEAYYQEIGRAGRDGLPSRAILMHSYADRHTHDFFIDRDYPDPAVLEAIFSRLGPEAREKHVLQRLARVEAEVFDKALEKLWVHGGAVVDYAENVSRGHTGWRESYRAQAEHKRAQIELVIRYAEGRQCRMCTLVRHFGDFDDSRQACGICDFCAPGECAAQQFRDPTPLERSAAAKVIATLSGGDSRPTGRLHTELFSDGAITRDRFEEILGGMARAGLVRLADAVFEKEGRSIPYRKVSLTREGAGFADTEDIPFSVKEDVVGATGKARKKRGAAAGTAAKKKTKKKSRGAVEATAPAARPPRARPAAVPAAENSGGTALEDKLRAWRLAEAKKRGVPAFRIFTDQTLRALAVRRPESARDLLAIPGVGIRLVEQYGSHIFRILHEGS